MQPRSLNLAALTVNSSLAFGLGTVLALLLYQLGLVASGLLFGRDPEWYPDRVEFTAPGSEVAWSGGVVLVLLVGWALASIYQGGDRYDGTRLAVLWVTLHSFRQGLVALVQAPLTEESDVTRALATADLPDGVTWAIGALGAAGLLGLGLFAAPALLRFARARQDLTTRRGRVAYLSLVGLLAWVVGALLVLPLLGPAGGSDTLRLLPWSGIFLVVTLVVAPEPEDTEPVGQSVRLSWGTLLLLALLIASARLLLADGLSISI